MSGQLVECVPNFSEARMPAASRQSWPRCAWMGAPAGLVDGRLAQPLGGDHRGEPAAVVEAAIRGVGKAVDLIDLTGSRVYTPDWRGGRDSVCAISGIKLEQCAAGAAGGA